MNIDFRRRTFSRSRSFEIVIVLFKMFSSILLNNKSLWIELDKAYRA